MASEIIGTLEDEARKRRERLKALREQRKDSGVPTKKEKLDLPKPELKLRNYTPMNDDLKESQLDDAKPGAVEEHIKASFFCACAHKTTNDARLTYYREIISMFMIGFT